VTAPLEAERLGGGLDGVASRAASTSTAIDSRSAKRTGSASNRSQASLVPSSCVT